MKILSYIYIFLSFFFLFFGTKEGLSKHIPERTSKTKKLKSSTIKINITSNSSSKHKKKKYKVKNESPSKNFAYYFVKKGDTLFSIAKKHGITVDELKAMNNLKTYALKPGQKLLISKNISKMDYRENKEEKEIASLKKLDPHLTDYEEEKFTYYTVKKGDTLFSIAKRYGITVEELKNINQLDHNFLKVGQLLKIPAFQEITQHNDFILHYVQEGETLYRISLKYGIPIEEIKKFNNLQENVIVVGQILKVPVLKSLDQPFILENPVAYYQEEEESLSQKFKKMKEEREKIYLKEKFLKIAEEYQNVRYKLGGNGNGYLDCSMFVKLVYEEFGIKLPRSSVEQFKIGRNVEKHELLPGDLVFFKTRGNTISHVGIYLGDNKFIHVSSRKKGLAIDSLEEEYYRVRYAGAKRILNIQ